VAAEAEVAAVARQELARVAQAAQDLFASELSALVDLQPFNHHCGHGLPDVKGLDYRTT
jgi:hypothetical protein